MPDLEQDAKKGLSNAEQYIRVGQLLQKKRSPELQAEIQRILDSDLAIEEKLTKIEQTDRASLTRGPVPEKTGAENAAEIAKRKNILSQDSAQKNILTIKPAITRVRFLPFLFGEYARIKAYAHKTRLIKTGFLNLKLNPVKAVYISVQKDAALLKSYVDFALESGWVHLDKLEYNLLVQFSRLCQVLSSTHILDSDQPLMMLEKLRKAEMYFLVCHYKPDYPDLISSSLAYVLKNYQKGEEKATLAESLVKRILFPSWEMPGLYHLLLSINCVAYRKFLTVRDLIAERPGGIISKFDFDCPDSVHERIRVYLTDQETRLQELTRLRYEISKLNSYMRKFTVSGNGRGGFDYSYLITFYESGTGQDKYRFSRDKENMYLLSCNLMRLFMRDFDSLLTGRVKLEEWGDLTLFTNDFFHYELSRMQNYFQKMVRMNFSSPAFTVERYTEIKRDAEHSHANREEFALISLLDEFSNLMLELGRKFGMLAQGYREKNTVTTDEIDFRPLDPSVLISGTFYVPFWNKKVLHPLFFEGQTLNEMLGQLASLTLLIGAFYLNTQLSTLMEREIKVMDELQKIKLNLERVSDVAYFEKLKGVYQL